MKNNRAVYSFIVIVVCLMLWRQIVINKKSSDLLRLPHCYTTGKITDYTQDKNGYTYFYYSYSYQDSTFTGSSERLEKSPLQAKGYLNSYVTVVFSLEDYSNSKLLLDGEDYQWSHNDSMDRCP